MDVAQTSYANTAQAYVDLYNPPTSSDGADTGAAQRENTGGGLEAIRASGTEEDKELVEWMDSVYVDEGGSFVHDVGVDGLSSKEAWSRFRDFGASVLGGMSYLQTTSELFLWKSDIAAIDLKIAQKTQREVGSMYSEYEGLKAAVSTKDPDAVQNAINDKDDRKVLVGMLMVVDHRLEEDPTNADLTKARDTLTKMLNGNKVSEADLIQLEPHMESLGNDLFPPEVRPDYVVTLVEQAFKYQDKNYSALKDSRA